CDMRQWLPATRRVSRCLLVFELVRGWSFLAGSARSPTRIGPDPAIRRPRRFCRDALRCAMTATPSTQEERELRIRRGEAAPACVRDAARLQREPPASTP